MNTFPLPVIIKNEEDIVPLSSRVDIIDLDDYVSTEEKITNWNLKVRGRIKNSFGIECETSLENLMKWYIETLNQEIFNIEANHRFILFMEKHLQYFYSYFKELNWISTDSYLEYMEDMLAFYLDYQGKIYIKEKGKQKRNKRLIRKKLLSILKLYLLNKEERIHHVLMKMKLNLSSNEAKNYLDNIYRVVFSQKPTNKSDAAFCRAFILYQKWKRIQVSEIWKTLDDMLHETYSREPDSICTNTIWKEISSCKNSLIEVIAQIGDNDKIFCDAYFKFIKSQTIQENLNALNVTQFQLDGQSSRICNIDLDIGAEGEFESLLENCEQNRENVEYIIKSEIESDEDDCVIVAEGTIKIDPCEIVYEILDDNEDIVEISNLKIHEPCANIEPTLSERKNCEEISFLDSIGFTENLSKNSHNDKNALLADSISSTVPKLQTSDNSVKPIDILSRKFTRKKDDIKKPMNIDVEPIKIDEPVKLDYVVKPVKVNEVVKLDVVKPFENSKTATISDNIIYSEIETYNLNTTHSTFLSCNPPKSTGVRSFGSDASPTSPCIPIICDPNGGQEPETLKIHTEAEPIHEIEIIIPLSPSIALVKETNDKQKEVVKLNSSAFCLGSNIKDNVSIQCDNDKNINTDKQFNLVIPRVEENKASSEKKIDLIFTQKVKKPDNEVHCSYDSLAGAIKKMHTSKNISTPDIVDFDMSKENHIGALSPQDITHSPSDLVSPEYDGIDDFGHYLANYQQETCNKICTPTIFKDSIIQRKENILKKSEKNKNMLSNNQSVKTRVFKRKRIVFAKEVVVNTFDTHKPPNMLCTKKPRIPFEHMNPNSLAYYRIEPNDPHLQSEPQVLIEKLSVGDIEEWEYISERSRMKTSMISPILITPKNSPMTLFRVNYDKSTPCLTNNYRVLDDITWKANNHQKIELLKEGTVHPISNDYTHISSICSNFCCSFLTYIFENLNISPESKSNINLISPVNPFRPKTFEENEAAYDKPTDSQDYVVNLCSIVDLKIVSEIVESFDKCSQSLTSSDIMNQPTISKNSRGL